MKNRPDLVVEKQSWKGPMEQMKKSNDQPAEGGYLANLLKIII